MALSGDTNQDRLETGQGQESSDTKERVTMCLFKIKVFWENQWAICIRDENSKIGRPTGAGRKQKHPWVQQSERVASRTTGSQLSQESRFQRGACAQFELGFNVCIPPK